MMKPIYEFQTIQVELTNACVHECSNCTRFCGHHKKPFFMDWDTFKKAVDSLEDWPRTLGIMGGEPTLHPEFERFVKYAKEKHPMQYDIGGGHKPISSLSKYMIDANGIKNGPLNKFKGLGLWSSVCNKYYEHYELIQDSFIYQCINDHTASSRHQAWLMTRKEFGISDEEWIKMRDNCWWQRLLGSPSITPKGAFFCEVAAAMDMLFNGPGGWKIEKGWWKRGPEDYKDQLMWCEFCSGAFHSFDRDANESVDDVSPYMYKKLQEIDSPKLKREGAVCVHSIGNDSDIEIEPRKNLLLYQPDHELRFTNKNRCLYPRTLTAVTYIKRKEELNLEILESNRKLFDKYMIITNDESIQKQVSSDFEVRMLGNHSVSRLFAKICLEVEDWIAITNPEVQIDSTLREKIDNTIFNPGTIHIFEEEDMLFFNVRASAYKKAGFDGISSIESIRDLIQFWPKEKIALVKAGFEKVVEPDWEEWNETILKKGIMNWNFLLGHMGRIGIDRIIRPQLDAIMKEESLAKKMQKLDDMKIIDVSQEMLVNAVKTFIHNEIGHASIKMSIEQMIDELKTVENSFTALYALGMLNIGEAKEIYLVKCVLHPKNKYYLGLATLKAHWNAYDRKKAILSEQTYGIIEDVLRLSKEEKMVLVGNRYTGKSIEMILKNSGAKPYCFADEEKQGFGYDGLLTLSFQDTLKAYQDKKFLMTECGVVKEKMEYLLEHKGFEGEMVYLHPLTIEELGMTPTLEEMHMNASLLSKLNENLSCVELKNIIFA